MPQNFWEISCELNAMKCNSLGLKDYAQIYAKIHCQTGVTNKDNIMKNDAVIGAIMTQHHISKGLKVFGDQGVEAVLTEMKQLHDRMVIEPTDSNKLS